MVSHNFKDIKNMRFGKLTVVDKTTPSKSGNARWVCLCDCGNKTIVIGSHLRSGHTTSCGCNKLSDQACGFSDTRLYRIWVNMHKRCYDKNHDSYKWYGGRGIRVCNEWKTFLTFKAWAERSGYEDSLSIDREDGDGNYTPMNCRWQTQKEQMNNVSSNKIITFNGENLTQSEFADKYNLKYHTVTNRLRAGWSVERIVNTPEVGEKNAEI